jgi:hypothetical protein
MKNAISPGRCNETSPMKKHSLPVIHQDEALGSETSSESDCNNGSCESNCEALCEGAGSDCETSTNNLKWMG